MRLSDEQYEEIKNVVADAFVEYDVKSIPISAFEMAIKMGIGVVPYSALSSRWHTNFRILIIRQKDSSTTVNT